MNEIKIASPKGTVTDDIRTVKTLIHNMNFELLKAQKSILIDINAKFKMAKSEEFTLEGLLALIDSIQDIAVDTYGYDKELVFNLSDEKEKPTMSLKQAKSIVLKNS